MSEQLEQCPHCNHVRHYGVCGVKHPYYCFCSRIQSLPQPRPWSLHRTGSRIGIKSADGKFVFRKTVSAISSEAYDQILADFEHIVMCVNGDAMEATQRPN